jgi:hypothetical protein
MSTYSLSKIHLPENKFVVKTLQNISLICVVMGLIFSTIGFIYPSILSISIIGLLFLSFTVFAETKLNQLTIAPNSSKRQKKLLSMLSIISSLGGFIVGILLVYSEFIVVGVCFTVISFSLFLAKIKFSSRYYVLDLMLFLVLISSVFFSLENVYVFLSSAKPILSLMPLYTSFSLAFLSLSVLFIWPDRGFMDVFTADAVSNKYSLRILFISVFISCVSGALIILGIEQGAYSPFEAIGIFAVVYIVLSVILIWINLRFLYTSELERFLMKEELRVHNISVNLSNEDLINKMVELEGDKNEYAKKLSYQKKVMDISENLP